MENAYSLWNNNAEKCAVVSYQLCNPDILIHNQILPIDSKALMELLSPTPALTHPEPVSYTRLLILAALACEESLTSL